MKTLILDEINGKELPINKELEVFFIERWDNKIEQAVQEIVNEVYPKLGNDVQSLKIKISIELNDTCNISGADCGKKTNGFQNGRFNLSKRENQILLLIMKGFTNREIADILFINFETVRSHRKNILRNTGCRNTAALVDSYHKQC